MKNKICALVLYSAVLGVGSAEAAYVSVTNATNNGSMATALSLDTKFDKASDANIGNVSNANISTTFFHASANAVTTAGGNGLDWYSFSTYQKNVRAYFDIDQTSAALNSFIKVFNSGGSEIAFNNNASFTPFDSGSTTNNDSFLSLVLNTPGLYYVSVGRSNPGGNQAGLQNGHNYTLHVSLADHTPPSAVPVPAAVWLFGSGLAGLLGVKRKKNTFISKLS